MASKNKKTKQIVSFHAGMCPECGKENLHYDEQPSFYADTVRFNFECKHCHAYGYEESIVEFVGTLIGGGKSIDRYYENGCEVEVKK